MATASATVRRIIRSAVELLHRSAVLGVYVAFVLPAIAGEPSTGPSPQPADGSRTARAAPPPKVAAELLRRHNAARKAASKPALRINAKLNSAAQKFAQFMAHAQKYDHDADGRSPAERIEAEGYYWSSWAENIAWGTNDPVKVFDVWMNSERHRENILGDELEVGFGFSAGVWVALFATPAREHGRAY